MAKKNEIVGYPSDFDSREKKESLEWGRKYLKAMWKDASKRGSSYSFESRARDFIENRKYSEGKQSIEKYKNILTEDNDSTYMNIDWDVPTALPEAVDYIRGQILNHPYKPTAKAIDSLSLSEADKKKRELQFNLMMKSIAPQVEEATGKNPIKGGDYVPEDEEDIDLYMTVNYKQQRCMAMEELVRHFKLQTDFRNIEKKIAKDLIDLKIAGTRVYVDVNGAIRARYIDPVNLVTDWVKKDDFSDAKHVGEVIKMTISELRIEAQGQLTEEELYNIAKSVAGKNGNDDWTFGDRRYYNSSISEEAYNHFSVKVLDAEVRSVDRMRYQKMSAKNGGFYFQLKDSNYQPPKNPKRKREIVDKDIELVYTGKYIVDTDYVYDWGVKQNMIRERLNSSYSTTTPLSFIINAPDIYEMENKSLVERMRPLQDRLAIIDLKMQQHIAKAAPSGYAINVDAVNSALAAMGVGGMTPLDARKIRDGVGDIYFRATREDGVPLLGGSQPVTALPNGLDQTIERLSAEYNRVVDRMKEVAGIPRGIDGSKPDQKALVGTQKLAAEGSNNTLRVIREAFFDIQRRTFNQVCNLYQDLIKTGVAVDEVYNALGEDVLDTFELTDLTNSDFNIDIKMLPTEEDKAILRQYINIALERDTIDVADSIVAEDLMDEDVDKAAVYFVSARKKYLRRKQQEAMANAQANAQQQQQSTMAAAEAEQIKQQAQAQSKIAVENNKIERELQKELELEEAKRKTMALEQEYQLQRLRLAAELKQDKDYDVTKETSPSGVEPDVMPSEMSGD